MTRLLLSALLVVSALPVHAGMFSANDTVATVGRFVIRTQDVLDSYEFGPAFVKRSFDPLRKHLEFMINERLLALEAERLRLDTTEFVRERVAALEEDGAVDELYRQEIQSRVQVGEGELDTAVQKARMRVRLRWLFSPERARALELAAQAQRGLFDSLFLQQEDSLAERSLETTALGLELSTPDFAEAIRSLRVREVSPAIEGPDGYYIVRIDQIWQNPLLTESEEARIRAEAASAVRAAKAQHLASAYVKEKMRNANPVIKAEGYNIVRAHLAAKGLSHDTRVKWDTPSTFMTEAGPMPITASDKFLQRPLVVVGKRMFTVRDYLRWFDIRQPQLKRFSLAAFNASVKQSIWTMVRDKLLSEEAYARGLHQRADVRHATLQWEAKILYLAMRSHLARTIVVSDSALRHQFRRQQSRYRTPDGKPMAYAEVRDRLWAEEYLQQERTLVFRTLQRLRAEHPVTINEKLVEELAATLRPDSHAIEVKVYKPGGTFPRVAFPTIDERWQMLSY